MYRAVDSNGQTLDFMLSEKRNQKAAKRFLRKILKARHNEQPRVINMAITDAEASSACLAINVDKNPAYPIAFEELKQEGLLSTECELRPEKYLNNLIEQDHRFPKNLAKYKSYFQYFHTAWRTLRGSEIEDAMSEVASDISAVRMNAIRKGQVKNIDKGDILGQRDFIHSLFKIAV